ncbi:hypothetical protein BDQ17DRAFT_1426935 [Cyathus striatus]|nr:hypothetical protein BDQ17DRAFT_1426935 [Cyathus striatus]
MSSPIYSPTSAGKNCKSAEPAIGTAAWFQPLPEEINLSPDELKAIEQQVRVDQVRDMIPFWLRGIEAAERGETLKLGDFLESLQNRQNIQESWIPPNKNTWGYIDEHACPEAKDGWIIVKRKSSPRGRWCKNRW